MPARRTCSKRRCRVYHPALSSPARGTRDGLTWITGARMVHAQKGIKSKGHMDAILSLQFQDLGTPFGCPEICYLSTLGQT